MKKIVIGISLTILAVIFHSCQLEQVHAVIPVDFEFTVECYTASFNTASQGAVTWDFGDGTTSEEQNPVHRYSTAGAYEVSLTIQGEQGAGKRTKSLNLIVNGTTFQQETNDYFGTEMSTRVDGGGYYIVANLGNNPYRSVLSFSENGQLENTWATGSNFSDYVSYYNTVATRSQALYNDKENGSVNYTFSDNQSGAFLSLLSAPDTNFTALNSAIASDGFSLFSAGIYNSDLTGQSGAFVWLVKFGLIKTVLLDIVDPFHVKIQATLDGGAALAILDPQQGIYVMKLDEVGQRVWGRFISNSLVPVSSISFPTISIVPIGDNDFVVASSELNLLDGTAGGTGFVFRVNENSDSWRKEIPGFTHVRDLLLNSNGDIMICGGFNRNRLYVPYLVQMDQNGEIRFEREILDTPTGNILVDILETNNEEFLLLGNKASRDLSLFQVDCGGNI